MGWAGPALIRSFRALKNAGISRGKNLKLLKEKQFLPYNITIQLSWIRREFIFLLKEIYGFFFQFLINGCILIINWFKYYVQ